MFRISVNIIRILGLNDKDTPEVVDLYLTKSEIFSLCVGYGSMYVCTCSEYEFLGMSYTTVVLNLCIR